MALTEVRRRNSMRETEQTPLQPNSTVLEGNTTNFELGKPPATPNPHGLCSYNDLPDWQKDNNYIRHGYVRETNSWPKTFRSLSYLHNETVNIFTHMLPGSLFPLALLAWIPFETGNFLSLPHQLIDIPRFDDTGTTDTIIFSIFFFGFISCLSLSAAFHTIKCHSHNVMAFGNSLDYAGIVIMIATSLAGIIFYALCDFPKARISFLTLNCAFATAAMFTTFDPKFRTAQYRPFRTAVFIAFGLSGALPIAYGLYEVGPVETVNRSGLWFVLLEALGYISGALLYAARVPERWSPGTFDFFGHSHQIFHILVVLSALAHFKALVQSYIYAHTYTY